MARFFIISRFIISLVKLIQNMSGITLNVNTKEPYNYGEDYLYNILIYFEYYNILEIKSGMADLLFRN